MSKVAKYCLYSQGTARKSRHNMCKKAKHCTCIYRFGYHYGFLCRTNRSAKKKNDVAVLAETYALGIKKWRILA